MSPVVLFVVALVAVAVALAWRRAADERAWTHRFLADFGRPVERERDLERVSAWYDARVRAGDHRETIDERTWRDLDMDAVWQVVDRTASQVGAQELYDRLHRLDATDGDRERFERWVEAFRGSQERRERVTLELLRMRAWHVSYLPDLLWGELPARSPLPWLHVAQALLAVVLLALLPVWPRALIALIALFLVNYLSKLALRSRIDPYVPSLRALPLLIAVADGLSQFHDAEIDEALEVLRRRRGSLRLLKRASRWVTFETSSGNAALGAMADLARSFQEYFNIAFLVDVNAFNFAIDRLRKHQGALREVFEALGTLDSAISVASLRTTWQESWTRPHFTGGERRLRAEGIRHPLLADAVPNDFVAADASWLVTGSNMSGKSTFLRTVGVNALLARTINTCRATRWEGVAFEVRSSIGRSDSLLDGKSYYLAEVESVRRLFDAAVASVPTLFILDELFRGTNAVERIAAARAVLESLDRSPHLVLVATHDIELLRWLGGRYEAWHFREQVHGDELLFDYRLRRGPSSTRNALAILRLKGFPEDVVQLAEATIPRPTLFEAVGGSDGVLRLAHAWHERVLADEVVSHAFSHGFRPDHTERLAAYWGEAWGGAPAYSARYGSESSVVRLHSGNGEHADMDRRAIACFDQAMEDVAIADPRLRQVLHDYFAWTTTTTMAAYPDRTDTIPGDLHIPRWSWEGRVDA